MQMPNLLFWEGKAKAHLRASRVRACPLRPAARLRPRLPGAPSPARPGSSRASAWAPRSESLGNGAGSADPRPGKPARTQQRRRGAREGRTDRLPAGLQTPTRAPPLQGPLPPAARGAAAQVPPPGADPAAGAPLLPSRGAPGGRPPPRSPGAVAAGKLGWGPRRGGGAEPGTCRPCAKVSGALRPAGRAAGRWVGRAVLRGAEPRPRCSPARSHALFLSSPRRCPPQVLAPSPCAGHEEPRGAARRRRGPGCAHTSPAAHGDMSGARGLQRPAASPSPRRPAGRRCPGE
ncbi:hypothetical protein VULLAG_LOCUS19933 [Vulpes lagopus]